MEAQSDPKVQMYSALFKKVVITNTIVRNIGKLEDHKEIEQAAKFLLCQLVELQKLTEELPIVQEAKKDRISAAASSIKWPSKHANPKWMVMPKELQEKLGLEDAMLANDSGETANTPAQPDLESMKEEFGEIFWENMLRQMDSNPALSENTVKIAPPNVISEENEKLDVHSLVFATIDIIMASRLLVTRCL